jgi:hypothetical protein
MVPLGRGRGWWAVYLSLTINMIHIAQENQNPRTWISLLKQAPHSRLEMCPTTEVLQDRLPRRVDCEQVGRNRKRRKTNRGESANVKRRPPAVSGSAFLDGVGRPDDTQPGAPTASDCFRLPLLAAQSPLAPLRLPFDCIFASDLFASFSAPPSPRLRRSCRFAPPAPPPISVVRCTCKDHHVSRPFVSLPRNSQ